MRAEAYALMGECEESYWWYRARRGLIAGVVARTVPAGSAVLDYGCGTGATTERLARDGYRVTGVEPEELAREAGRRRGLTVLDPDDLASSAGAFDLVLACDVIEHVEDDAGLLGRLRTLLRPTGRLLVTVPAYEFLWSGEDYVSKHVRRYTRRELRNTLGRGGFRPAWCSYFNTVLFPPACAAILWGRLFRPRDMYRSNIRPLPRRVDDLLGRAFALERFALGRVRLPFGLSLMAVASPEGSWT